MLVQMSPNKYINTKNITYMVWAKAGGSYELKIFTTGNDVHTFYYSTIEEIESIVEKLNQGEE